MKTFLMMILFAGGFAIQQIDAQNCCLPCPPGCCITSCSKSVKGSAVDGNTTQPVEATFASFLVAAQETLGQTSSAPVSKECLPSCQATKISMTSSGQPGNGAPASCKTNFGTPSKCGTTTAVASSTSTRLKERG